MPGWNYAKDVLSLADPQNGPSGGENIKIKNNT